MAQNPDLDSSEVMRQLLSLPAPMPLSGKAPTTVEPKKQRSPKFFAQDNPPPDDAPREDILEYWDRWADMSGRPAPSDAVRQRLLDACLDDLERLPKFLTLFSSSEAAAAKVKELFDTENLQTKIIFNEVGFVKS